MVRPLIIDCDTGADDAVAILMAFASPESFDILGICTTSGNAPLESVQRNTRQICDLAGQKNAKVFAGCPRPILVAPLNAAYAHGDSGMDGAILPDPITPLQSQHAVDFYQKTLKESTQKITVVITGPMTNLAIALVKDPDIADHIEELIIMGGTMGSGNVTPSAEFNIYADPHAAAIIVKAGIRLTMVGLDVTHRVTADEYEVERYLNIGNEVGRQVGGILRFAMAGDRERFDLDGRAVHDACTIAYLLRPDLFRARPAHIMVDTSRSETRGATAISFYPKFLTKENKTFFVDDIQEKEVKNLIYELMARFPLTDDTLGARNAG